MAGGNYGIGKNAVLNVSDLKTVFYGTRYIGRDSGPKGRVRGRIDKIQGKATLRAHPDPDAPDEILQHIGFYIVEGGGPLIGARNIRKSFVSVTRAPESSLWASTPAPTTGRRRLREPQPTTTSMPFTTSS